MSLSDFWNSKWRIKYSGLKFRKMFYFHENLYKSCVFGSLISNLLSEFQNSRWWIQYDGKKFRKISNFYGNLYMGVFRNADYEYAVRCSKLKMAVPIWLHNIENWFIYMKISWKFVYSGFLDRWFRIRCQIFKIQDGGSNMTKTNFEKFLIFMKICTWGFSGMLITNPMSNFENSKWRFQYSGNNQISYINSLSI